MVINKLRTSTHLNFLINFLSFGFGNIYRLRISILFNLYLRSIDNWLPTTLNIIGKNILIHMRHANLFFFNLVTILLYDNLNIIFLLQFQYKLIYLWLPQHLRSVRIWQSLARWTVIQYLLCLGTKTDK